MGEFEKAVEALRDVVDKIYPGAELYISITIDPYAKPQITLDEVDKLAAYLDKNGLKGLQA